MKVSSNLLGEIQIKFILIAYTHKEILRKLVICQWVATEKCSRKKTFVLLPINWTSGNKLSMKDIFTFYKCILSFKYASVSITLFTSHRNPVNCFRNFLYGVRATSQIVEGGVLFLRTCFPLKVDVSVDRMLCRNEYTL